jgi:hypothetical protein
MLGLAQQFLFLSTALGLLNPLVRFLPTSWQSVVHGSTLLPPMLAFFNLLTSLVIKMPAGGAGIP